jgi:hypothetical protein
MAAPQIIVGGEAGRHNEDPASVERVRRSRMYADLSTICVIPTRGSIPARVVESWWDLIKPLNQSFRRVFVSGMEVADAYNEAIETILGHPILSTWRYVLMLEEDNLPPPRGLLKLYESMEEFACVGGLYWSKSEDGFPMIYGAPGDPSDIAPQVPVPDAIQECNALGMGFTLFRLDVFRDERIERPWFRTLQAYSPEYGPLQATQDMHFFAKVRRAGYRVACDTRVRVGHLDAQTGIVW